MKATFENTISILVKAYIADELVHGSCAACAVGNIVAASVGTKPRKAFNICTGFDFVEMENGYSVAWPSLFMTVGSGQRGKNSDFLIRFPASVEAIEEVKKTGYSVNELAKIEFAFESADKEGCSVNDGRNQVWMFNGLMAVVDVLADIHGIDLTTRENAKLQFVKA